MLKNYLKIAFRNLIRNKAFSAINILGLAIGMATCLLVVLYVTDELSYDRFHQDSNRIFQVNVSAKMGNDEFITGNTPPPVGKTLLTEIPEVETYTRIFRPGNVIVKRDNGTKLVNYFNESGVFAVDSNFFQVFTFKMLEGSTLNCLNEPDAVVITEKMAKKYFGGLPVMGQVLVFDNKPFKITGILADIPTQSSIQFDFLTSTQSQPLVKKFDWSWIWMQVTTYIKLRENVVITPSGLAKIEAKFPAMIRKNAANAFKRVGQPFDEFIKKGGRWELQLQSLKDVHLNSNQMGFSHPPEILGNIDYIYIFSIIAFFVVLLACVNFMNLSTARALKRAKEVGVRKVLGSFRASLVGQFLSESMIYSIISTSIAILLVGLALPLFNQISGKALSFDSIFSAQIVAFIISLVLLTGFLAGLYPAFYLTSFNPVTVLKGGALKSGFANLLIRNGLVVFQFSISTGLIICTVVVFNQLHFLRSEDIGYKRENVIIIPNAIRLEDKQEIFRSEVSRLPEVTNASISTDIPTGNFFADFYLPEQTATDKIVMKDLSLASYMVDEEFVPTMEMKIIQGRNFSKEFSDSLSVILNEAAVKEIGWKEPIGRFITYNGNNGQKFKVVGVVKDFSLQSLRQNVASFGLFHVSSRTYTLSTSKLLVRVRPSETSNLLGKMEMTWKSFVPDVPFDYTFLDNQYESLYRAEQQMGSIFGILTTLAIFIACLGLFGLAAYIAEQKTKEIGIRKVLGASVSQIVTLLSKDFIRLVCISFLIASPIAWWAMNKWLQDFAYKSDISWWIFALAGTLTLVIALFTVSFQAIKSSLANPVKSLRTE